MNLISNLIPALNNMAEWLAIASLKTIPLIAFIFVIKHIFRKRLSAASVHLLWLSVFMSLSIPFGWDIHLERFTPDNSLAVKSSEPGTKNNSAPIFQQQIVIDTEITNSQPGFTPAQTASWVDIYTVALRQNYHLILACLWLSGTIILLGLTGISVLRFHRIKKNSSLATMDLLNLFNRCKMEMGLSKPIQLLSSHEIQSPIILGWLWPAIVLPQNIEKNLSSENLKYVLLHELGHIKRHDIFFNWTACLINILHWFNPLVWLAFKRMRMDMEIACDALVLSHLHQSQRKNYGATLIEISEIPRVSHRAITSLGILENHTDLKERLKMIKEFTTMNIKNTVFFGAILMLATITSLAQPTPSTTTKPTAAVESKATTDSQSTITLQEFAAIAEKDLKVKVLVGQDDASKNIPFSPSNEPLNYGQLLTQLKINEFTAYKSKDYIQIIKIRDARYLSIPTVEKNGTYYDDEIVTDYFKMEKACAGQILATTRPLVPQYGHLTTYADSRTLIIVDTYANIQRIRSVIKVLEERLNKPMDCSSSEQSTKKPS
jgi:beta-lactamase regulating signal transducer with metallopeptidase domain